MDLESVARLTTILVMVAVAIGALELLASPAVVRDTGFYSWRVLRTAHPWALGPRGGALADSMFGPGGMSVVWVSQVAAALLAIADVGPALLWILVALAGNLLLHVRNTYGLDGSDQMQAIVLAALLLYHVAPDDTGRRIALGFVAAQSLLSYFAAGIAKSVSPVWRNGTAIAGVLDTLSYGTSRGTRIINRWPALSTALCWSTLAFECAMPLLVFVSPQACLVFLGVGLAFHAGIALAMGLNLFFWSFAATYPCVYLLSTWVADLRGGA